MKESKENEVIKKVPLILVPQESTLCTPPANTMATASLITYIPKTCGHRLNRIWFLPTERAEGEEKIFKYIFKIKYLQFVYVTEFLML